MTTETTTTAAESAVKDDGSAPQQAPGLLARALVAVIGVYRAAISPRSLPSCRYLPTCSEYALDAVRSHGAGRGTWLAVRRLLRCHPFHAGGFDPVPPPRIRPAASAAAAGRPAAPAPHVVRARPAR